MLLYEDYSGDPRDAGFVFSLGWFSYSFSVLLSF